MDTFTTLYLAGLADHDFWVPRRILSALYRQKCSALFYQREESLLQLRERQDDAGTLSRAHSNWQIGICREGVRRALADFLFSSVLHFDKEFASRPSDKSRNLRAMRAIFDKLNLKIEYAE
jgi:hypothetical protein